MEQRIVDFITALRAAGVRISMAESADALRAIEAAGITEKDLFRLAMRAALVKEGRDLPTFDRLFDDYFGQGEPSLQQTGGGMSPEDQEKMMQQMMEMLRTMTPEQLRQLFEAMMTGQGLSPEEIRELVEQNMQNMRPGSMPMSGMPFSPQFLQRAARQMLNSMRFDKLDEFMQELLEKLREAGISEEQLAQLAQQARANQAALENQIAREIGRNLARQMAEQRRQHTPEELLDQPFEELNYSASRDDLRALVARLAAQLRARAAIRQKRAERGTLDAKRTIRTNLRYQGVPIELRKRRRRLKPRIVVMVDRSVSTETVVRFLLLLVYTLQDQISRTRAFAYIETIYDISTYFDEHRPEQAIDLIMHEVRPRRSYSTDLGASLKAFTEDYGGTIDRRTTVIVLGDGRNNENDPGLQYLQQIRQRARRIVWFNPEHPSMWGQYDYGSLSSDMKKYEPLCDAVHYVSNLRQLADAVETLFVR